jgi:probable F420-dependent oxidoreductase
MVMFVDAFAAARSLAEAQVLARQVERAGFGRLWLPEGTAPVFSMCAAAALAAPCLPVGTGIAVAFARSPMITAQAAWMLADATGGNFTLGLGTQVRAHVERRFSAPFEHPGPRLREYVLALRAIFDAFAERARLSFEGDFYSFTLLPKMWRPAPLPYPDPPVYLAGVKPWMCQMIGETADGMKVHPLHTAAYLDQVVRPCVAAGAARAGREPASISLACPVMTAVADDEESLARQRETLRGRIAFYGSTPGYGVVFDVSGWPGIGERLSQKMRDGDHAGLAALVTDDILDAIAITATWDDLPGALVSRYHGKADRVVCYSAVEHWREDPSAIDRWRDVVTRVRKLLGSPRQAHRPVPERGVGAGPITQSDVGLAAMRPPCRLGVRRVTLGRGSRCAQNLQLGAPVVLKVRPLIGPGFVSVIGVFVYRLGLLADCGRDTG